MRLFFAPPPTAEKASEILKEVKRAQERFKQQRDIAQLEAEVGVSAAHTHTHTYTHTNTCAHTHPHTHTHTCAHTHTHTCTHTQVDSSKLMIHEQNRRISELEAQLSNQNITIKLLQAEKDHAFLLSQHVKDLSNQMGGRSGAGYRPHSAEARR